MSNGNYCIAIGIFSYCYVLPYSRLISRIKIFEVEQFCNNSRI